MMGSNSSTSLAVDRLVRARNRELTLEAAVEMATGIGYCLVVFGFIFVAAWVVLGLMNLRLAASSWWIALAIAGLFFVVSFVEAWRRVDPFEGVRRLEDWQLLLTELSLASSQFMYFSPRHASAGLAFVLISGPENLISAVATWRTRLPRSAELVHQAASLLQAARHRPRADRIDTPQAALLLHRLGLIKARAGSDAPVIEPTQKGVVLLSQSSGVAHRRSE